PVVLGGVHVTILPEEAAEHADSLVIGRAEGVWPQLLRDFKEGKLRKVYQELEIEGDWLLNVPVARRDLQRHSGYMMPNTLHATRGCKHSCDFCTVAAVWPKYLKRPVADVIEDIKSIKSKYFVFNDVSLLDDVEYSKELLSNIIPLKKRWGGLATTTVTENLELMELLRKSGCAYLLLGFETIEQKNLNKIYKGFNRSTDYRKVMEVMHEYGISVQGCFVLGLDQDDQTTFARTVELVNDLKIDIPRYSLYTPYPGTRLFQRLHAEKRILSFNWNDYDTMHVVIRPTLMTPEELYDGFKWTYRETFKMKHIAKRTRALDLSFPINFIGNLAYQIFVHRLYHEPRFALPHSLEQPDFDPSKFAKLNVEEASCRG
ncbi:MAG TPA: radical SAM protein, partial [Chroococcales cyanobacterium]